MTTSLRSSTRYPSGGTPPIHMPFLLDAAILSRMRSPMTSALELREGQQNIQRQAPHRGRRVELLRHRDKGGAASIEDLDDLSKIGKRAGQPVDLIDDHGIEPPRRDVAEEPLQGRPIHRRAREPAIVITTGQAHPAFLP